MQQGLYLYNSYLGIATETCTSLNIYFRLYFRSGSYTTTYLVSASPLRHYECI